MSTESDNGNGDEDDEPDEGGAGIPPVEDILPRTDTVNHWVLYLLDWFEAEHEPDDDGENPARTAGVAPRTLYEFASNEVGEDVFRDRQEVSQALSRLRRDKLAVGRRNEATDWDGPDNDYRYRVHDRGREALLEAGAPERLPNRQDAGHDRDLGIDLPHRVGWWMEVPPWMEWRQADRGSVEPDSEQHLVLYAVGEVGTATNRAVSAEYPVGGDAASTTLKILFDRQLLERRERHTRLANEPQYEYRLTEDGQRVLSDLGTPSHLRDGWERAGDE